MVTVTASTLTKTSTVTLTQGRLRRDAVPEQVVDLAEKPRVLAAERPVKISNRPSREGPRFVEPSFSPSEHTLWARKNGPVCAKCSSTNIVISPNPDTYCCPIRKTNTITSVVSMTRLVTTTLFKSGAVAKG